MNYIETKVFVLVPSKFGSLSLKNYLFDNIYTCIIYAKANKELHIFGDIKLELVAKENQFGFINYWHITFIQINQI